MEEEKVSLRDHLEVLLNERNKRFDEAIREITRAADKLEINNEKWRANANEWRAAMNDRERLFMPRNEATIQFEALSKQLLAIQARQDQDMGRSGGLHAGWAYLVGAVGAVAAIITTVILITRH